MNKNRRELNEKLIERQNHLNKANEAKDAFDTLKAAGKSEEATAKYNEFCAELKAAKDMNGEIDNLKSLADEEELYADAERERSGRGSDIEKAKEMGEALLKHGRVSYGVEEVRRAIKSTTLATGAIVKPTEVGGIHGDGIISSLIDQVRVVDLSGCGMISEAYEISDMEAKSGDVATLAGTARSASDPTFGYAEIQSVEVNVTSYVDRNLSRLTPLQYEARIRAMAMRALRRKINELIANGDGKSSPKMFGCKTAKNADGAAIYETLSVTSNVITADTLMDLVFAYGGNEELGGNARLFLNKADLLAIGKIRGTNEKKSIFKITPDAGNANTGVISDGGVFIPYTISSSCTALSGAQRHATNDIQTMFYGDPANYELGLFGAMNVRVSEEYKAAERMNTILGDAFVGGNLIVHKGMVVLTLAHGA